MAGPAIALAAAPRGSAPVRARRRHRGRAETRLRLLGPGARGPALALPARDGPARATVRRDREACG